MKNSRISGVSRRRFLLSTVVATAGVWLVPRWLLAAGESPVNVIRGAAGTAKINIHKLRGDISVLEGSGGNIAVLTGRDGKILVDAGISASRPQITEALASLSDDPVKHLINSHWHFDSYGRKRMAPFRWSRDHRTR